MSAPRVSIVSLTYRSLEDTREFMESVYAMTREPYEFFMVVNDVQEPELLDYLVKEELAGRVRLIWNPQNLGLRGFNQAFRLAGGEFILRCDSDIVVKELDWTRKFTMQWALSNTDIGNVGIVGPNLPYGYRVRRTANTVQTDMILGCCQFHHRPTMLRLREVLLRELPRMEEDVRRLKRGESTYPEFFSDLDCTLDYVRYHSPWFDLSFGGRNEVGSYGPDDFWISILALWAGLKMVTSSVRIDHKDASQRPGAAGDSQRHQKVLRGFQYFRTSLSLIMDEWSVDNWNEMPFRLPVMLKYRESGVQIA